MNDPEKERLEKELWARYREDPEPKNRDALITFYVPYVRYICGRIAMELPAHIKESDILSSGIEGLIDAVDRFDPSQDVQFRTYAFNRVRGSVYDELRRLDWAPRSLRRRAREIEAVENDLQQKLGRKVSHEEIAEAMSVPQDEVEYVFANVKATALLSLDEVFASSHGGDGEGNLIDTIADPHAPDPEAIMEAREMKELIAAAIEHLPEKEKKVMVLYYREGLTLKEVGAVLEVTESRVSQLHAGAIGRIVAFMKKELGGSLA